MTVDQKVRSRAGRSQLKNEYCALISKYDFNFKAGVTGETAAVNTTTWAHNVHSADTHTSFSPHLTDSPGASSPPARIV